MKAHPVCAQVCSQQVLPAASTSQDNCTSRTLTLCVKHCQMHRLADLTVHMLTLRGLTAAWCAWTRPASRLGVSVPPLLYACCVCGVTVRTVLPCCRHSRSSQAPARTVARTREVSLTSTSEEISRRRVCNQRSFCHSKFAEHLEPRSNPCH